ncbi:hypothetical protein I6D55_06770 [Staphylococcus aureus]|uniref:hypothetical protein n=2 Tax=Staphylococcus aureus TaxID=1280 RepID=UPI000699107E|nr:hypothetical protein [Staphylococcus aureus]MBH4693584.1 hypothetical protein [Staphylococcus aureus]MBH4696481.1 hypothetical protein [Staphylococcus aureus]MBH4701454.1 hypothetical protein [Staphylococcus aureus]MBH4704247.1 hypothetical protein [Staphylococcus aureus]MBH4706505.1 hypothetical protein [Staphylococcus aureus]
MKLNKTFGILIMSALLLSTSTPLARAQNITQNNENTNNKQVTEKSNADDKALDELFKNPERTSKKTIDNLPSNLKEGTSERVGGSYAVKKGIKAMIKNKKAVFNGVKEISPRAGKSLEKRWDKYVNPALNNVLKQEEATWGNVQGQVSQALMGTGIKDSTARSIGFWVSQVGQALI